MTLTLISRKGALRWALLILLTVAVPVTCVTVTGCRSASVQRTTYVSLSALGRSANAAVDMWLRYYLVEEARLSRNSTNAVALRVLRSKDAHVKQLYTRFGAAYALSVSAAALGTSTNAPASAELIRLSSDLSGVITALTVK